MSGKKECLHASKMRKRAISRSTRAQLQFPVSRVDRLLRESRNVNRLRSSTPVFLAGVLEYVTANILDLAGQEAEKNSRSRITPEHLCAAVRKSLRVDHCLEHDGQEQAKLHQQCKAHADTMKRASSQHHHRHHRHRDASCCQRCHDKRN